MNSDFIKTLEVKMLFVTRQPRKVMDYFLNEKKDYYYKKSFFDLILSTKKSRATPIKNKFGFHPIFVSSIDSDEDLIYSALTSNPSCIECYIVFETDDFERISYQKWIDYLGNENKLGNIELEEGSEPEYIVKSIRYDQIKKLIPVNRRFDKTRDMAYLLSEDFYRQTPLFEKTRVNLGKEVESRRKEFDFIFNKFVINYGVTNNKEQTLSDFRSEIRKLLNR